MGNGAAAERPAKRSLCPRVRPDTPPSSARPADRRRAGTGVARPAIQNAQRCRSAAQKCTVPHRPRVSSRLASPGTPREFASGGVAWRNEHERVELPGVRKVVARELSDSAIAPRTPCGVPGRCIAAPRRGATDCLHAGDCTDHGRGYPGYHPYHQWCHRADQHRLRSIHVRTYLPSIAHSPAPGADRGRPQGQRGAVSRQKVPVTKQPLHFLANAADRGPGTGPARAVVATGNRRQPPAGQAGDRKPRAQVPTWPASATDQGQAACRSSSGARRSAPGRVESPIGRFGPAWSSRQLSRGASARRLRPNQVACRFTPRLLREIDSVMPVDCFQLTGNAQRHSHASSTGHQPLLLAHDRRTSPSSCRRAITGGVTPLTVQVTAHPLPTPMRIAELRGDTVEQGDHRGVEGMLRMSLVSATDFGRMIRSPSDLQQHRIPTWPRPGAERGAPRACPDEVAAGVVAPVAP